MRIAQQQTACDAYHAHRGAGFAASQRERIKAFIALRGGDSHSAGRASGETTGVDL